MEATSNESVMDMDKENDDINDEHEIEDVGEGDEIGYGDDMCNENLDGVLETTIDKIHDSEIIKMEFDSDRDAFNFYKQYAKSKGFGVRCDDVGQSSKDNTLIWRQFVCHCEGKRRKKHIERVDRQREERRITRTGCLARLRVKLDKARRIWRVNQFEPEHNHELLGEKYGHLIPCHRYISEADKVQVNNLWFYGMKTAQVHGCVADQYGGFKNVSFTMRDLYNHFGRQRRLNIVDGDSNAAMGYLRAKSVSDPLFCLEFTNDKEGRLENLFWADGGCISDFQYFGDVLCFDTTYRTNVYNKPLVIFSGSNHHGGIVIFGAALLVDETEDTYNWVLEKLTKAMGDKKPEAVVTDGDKAMRKAIKNVFPNAFHRLCLWHLQKNAKCYIKNEKFHYELARIMYSDFEVDEFEEQWKQLIDHFKLEDNGWINSLYKKRDRWCSAYLRGCFFAGIRTTSRCEGINAFIDQYVESRHNLLEFLTHFDRAIEHYRNNEFNADFECKYGKPVLTSSLVCIEECASKIYTLEKFKDFRVQLKLASALSVCDRDLSVPRKKIFKVSRFRMRDRYWEVSYDVDNVILKCSCYNFETYGIPCSHILFILKEEDFGELPKCVILSRWTKSAKNTDTHFEPVKDLSNDQLTRLRISALTARCNWMSFLASKSKDDFDQIRDKVDNMICLLEGKQSSELVGSAMRPNFDVKDPATINTKGCPKQSATGKKRRRLHCSNCKLPGHTKRTCSQPMQKAPNVGTVTNYYSSESDDGNNVVPSSLTNNDCGDILSLSMGDGGQGHDDYSKFGSGGSNMMLSSQHYTYQPSSLSMPSTSYFCSDGYWRNTVNQKTESFNDLQGAGASLSLSGSVSGSRLGELH